MCKVTDELIEIGKEIGETIGVERGVRLGEERGIKKIVLRMAERGKTMREILDDTGISLEMARDWLGEAVPAGD